MAATAIKRMVLGAAAALILGGNALGALPASGAEATTSASQAFEVERYSRTKFYKDPYGGTYSVTCWYDDNHRQVGSCLVT
jgi:hypothetical protein